MKYVFSQPHEQDNRF